MFRSVMVPVDLSLNADRALPVAAALASRLGVPIDAVIVSSEGVDPALYEAKARADARGVGVELNEVQLSYDDDVVGGTLDQVSRQKALLCCAKDARGRIADVFFHGISEQLVCRSSEPLVLVGRRAMVDPPPRFGQLLVCVDGSRFADGIAAAATSWGHLISGEVRVLQVLDQEIDVRRGAGHPTAERVAGWLVQQDVDTTWDQVSDDEVAQRIIEEANSMESPVIVMGTHERHPRGVSGLGRVSRAVVRHGAHPVLVVPPPYCGLG